MSSSRMPASLASVITKASEPMFQTFSGIFLRSLGPIVGVYSLNRMRGSSRARLLNSIPQPLNEAIFNFSDLRDLDRNNVVLFQESRRSETNSNARGCPGRDDVARRQNQPL
jgi:hypothetical protein